MKLLLVGTGPSEACALRDKLMKHGDTVLACSSPDFAMDTVRRHGPFEFVIVDSEAAGGGNGAADLIAAIRAFRPMQDFLMTVSDPSARPPLGVRTLLKPFPVHRLLKLLVPLRPLPLFD